MCSPGGGGDRARPGGRGAGGGGAASVTPPPGPCVASAWPRAAGQWPAPLAARGPAASGLPHTDPAHDARQSGAAGPAPSPIPASAGRTPVTGRASGADIAECLAGRGFGHSSRCAPPSCLAERPFETIMLPRPWSDLRVTGLEVRRVRRRGRPATHVHGSRAQWLRPFGDLSGMDVERF